MDTDTIHTDIDRQFVGCLLWLPTQHARRVLTGMRADDLANPMAAEVLHLVIELVAAGHDPAPVAVYSHATATGRAPGEYRRGRLVKWLADTYGASQGTAPTFAYWLKGVVLEATWRRAVAEHATRLAQAAEHSPTDRLHDLADDTSHIDELWRRCQDALAPAEVNGIARALKEVA